MRSLRKRSCNVSYAESSGEEEFEEKPKVKKSRGNTKGSSSSGRAAKRRRTVDTACVLSNSDLSSDSGKGESTAAMNLSESGSDSEAETSKPKRKRQSRTVRSKRTSAKKNRKSASTTEEFDWTEVVSAGMKKEKDGNVSQTTVKASEDEDEDDEEEWEEVEEVDGSEETGSDAPVSYGIDITVSGDGSRARKSKKVDLEAELRREVARRQRLAQTDMHIVHLLCLLAHGRDLSRVCSCPEVAAIALSLIPDIEETENDRKKLQRVLKVGEEVQTVRDGRHAETVDEDLEAQLIDILSSNRAQTEKLRVLAICALVRASGLRARLLHALCPVPLKPTINGKGKSTPKPKPTRRKQADSDPDFKPTKRRRMVSEDDEEDESPCVTAWWLEVLCDGRWVTVDPLNGVIDQPADIEKKEHPLGPLYVVGFEAEGACRDVTAKYASRWCSQTRKLRLSSDAWEEEVMRALRKEGERALDAKEDDEIRERLLQLPPPKSTGDYNNHPLYALTRHLKKYEVIYPPDAGVLHFHKGEAVFARENVRLCHTRETWLKEARVVKIGEEPAKVVLSRTTSKQRVLLPSGKAEIDLFGLWQTEDYVPPVARDGIVPKNEHGNVDLFQEKMMPLGCVRLRLPGLGRIAKRLEIDVAQAMVGWEFHAGRWAHPVFDGWIVCREHVSTLCHAWLEAERAAQEKEASKREARAVGNWRLLVRGLMIRKRVQARYEFRGTAEASRVSSIAAGMKRRSGRD